MSVPESEKIACHTAYMNHVAWWTTGICLVLASLCAEGHHIFGHGWLPMFTFLGAAAFFAWLAHREDNL